nr:APL1B [Anopheles gambiae]
MCWLRAVSLISMIFSASTYGG